MIDENTCAVYIQTRRSAYVSEDMTYCRRICDGTKEMCQYKNYELTYKPIKSTGLSFRKGSLAMVVMGEK